MDQFKNSSADSWQSSGSDTWYAGTVDIEASVSAAAAMGDAYDAMNLSAEIQESIATDDAMQLSMEIEAADGVAGADVFARMVESERSTEETIVLSAGLEAVSLSDLMADNIGLGEIFAAQSDRAISIPGEIAALSDALDCINWSDWLRRNIGSAAQRFYFTLTGSADGEADIEIPISSFQSRLRQSEPTYLSVVIPNVDDYSAAIAARPNGQMVIEMAYVLGGEESVREEICRVDLESVRTDEGSRNQSITLSGHRTETYATKITVLTGVSYRNESDGVRRFRCAMDPYLKPGDTVRINDETMEVGYISVARSVKSELMEIVEA